MEETFKTAKKGALILKVKDLLWVRTPGSGAPYCWEYFRSEYFRYSQEYFTQRRFMSNAQISLNRFLWVYDINKQDSPG